MALATSAIVGLTVGVVLALGVVLLVGFLVCRMVYRHEHGRERRRSSVDSRGAPKLRGNTSSTSVTSGNTDFFVNKQEFNDMLANLEESWHGNGKSQITYNTGAVDMVNGAAIYSNPAFDSDRGKSFDAAVAIQSWYRGICVRRDMVRKKAQTDGRRTSVVSANLVQMNMYSVKTFGLTPTGGHSNTDEETLLKCLDNMHKRNSKKKVDHSARYLRLWITAKGIKVMSYDTWEIRHNIGLKDIFAYLVSRQSDQVFGLIFRRKGINYCFAVVCDGDDAKALKQDLEDAYFLMAARHPVSARRGGNRASNQSDPSDQRASNQSDFGNQRSSQLSSGGSSEAGSILSNIGSPQRHSANISFIPAIELSMPDASNGLMDPQTAAHTIQCWYRSCRTRIAYRCGQRRKSRPKSQSTELLMSLRLYHATFCAVSPVIREAATDRETLEAMVLQNGTLVRTAPSQFYYAGVSCKGLTILSASYRRIIYKIPLRMCLTYRVADDDTNVFALLFRSKTGLSSMLLKTMEAHLVCNAVNEAQLASTLRQLEVTRSHLPQGDSKRDLLESASTIVANLTSSESQPGATSATMGDADPEGMGAPRPEHVTMAVASGASTPGADKYHRRAGSSHSLRNIHSDLSMTAEAFADAAGSLLDDTLKETAQYMGGEMTRSPSKEIRRQMDEIITESTLELLDEVDANRSGMLTSTPVPARELARVAHDSNADGTAPSADAGEDLQSTIQGLLTL